MKIQSCLRALLVTVVSVWIALPAAWAEESPGAIVGIVTNSARAPVARATVTAARTDGGAIRATLSGSDGVYSFADLPPGKWSLTLQVDGHPDVTEPSLDVLAGKATRHDVVINVSTPALAATAVPAAPTVAGPAGPAGTATAAGTAAT